MLYSTVVEPKRPMAASPALSQPLPAGRNLEFLVVGAQGGRGFEAAAGALTQTDWGWGHEAP
jgi:hypothetical protein